jgi:hypothetical protein
VSGVGALRWIPLIYIFLYTWQLFPGLNRMFQILVGASALTAIYALYQHFAGIDVVRGMETLPYAPITGFAYSMTVGFYRHPEILGTVLSVILPLPIAAFMLADNREKPIVPFLALLVSLILAAAIFWTYKPGIWIAAIGGFGVTLLLQPRRHFITLVIMVAFISGLIFLTYGTPEALTVPLQKAEIARGERQRQEINEQVKIWGEHVLIGAGMKAHEVRSTESLDGNIYFQLLAQTGTLGLAFYLLFSLNFLLGVYRIWREIPATHYWHKVLVTSGMGSMAAFHVAGLYWPTLSDSHALLLFVFMISALSYLAQQYDRGLVPDDHSL